MTRFFAVVVVLVVGAGVVGCSSPDEFEIRYRLEKQLWTAQQLEKKISSKHPYDTFVDWQAADQAYRTVLARVATGDTETWESSTVKDLERIVLMTKLGLIRLCLMEYRAGAAVTYFKSDIFDFRAVSLDTAAVKLRLARPLYGSTNADTLACRPLLREIVESGALSLHSVPLGDTLLGFPVFFAQVIRDNGTAQRFSDTMRVGETFYGQVIDAWPNSPAGRKATFYRAQFRILANRLDEAEADVRSLVDQSQRDIPTADLLLLHGRILAAQGRLGEAEAAYEAIVADGPRKPRGYLARLNIAEVRICAGGEDEAVVMLREIEDDENASEEVIAKAALLRARVLERQGRWKDSLELLTWTCRLHPYTLAAVHAPLLALRHNLAEGDRRGAETTFKLATEYYLKVIAKDSAFLSFRHLVKDFLVECHLLMGREREVADLLEREGPALRGDNASVALLKSGLISMNLLGDPKKSAIALKKSVELFPHARYAKVAQSQLDRMATPRNSEP